MHVVLAAVFLVCPIGASGQEPSSSAATPSADDWITVNKNYAGQRFVRLSQITPKNVQGLKEICEIRLNEQDRRRSRRSRSLCVGANSLERPNVHRHRRRRCGHSRAADGVRRQELWHFDTTLGFNAGGGFWTTYSLDLQRAKYSDRSPTRSPISSGMGKWIWRSPGIAIAMAPRTMAWEASPGIPLSGPKLCANLLDKSLNGDRTPADLLKHIQTEPLVHWSFHPGTRPNGDARTTPPYTQPELIAAFKEWIADGTPCPTK
jgi:hypothetical protein